MKMLVPRAGLVTVPAAIGVLMTVCATRAQPQRPANLDTAATITVPAGTFEFALPRAFCYPGN
ncbi:MAG: hypothetical protein ABJF01_25255 [bacterium]